MAYRIVAQIDVATSLVFATCATGGVMPAAPEGVLFVDVPPADGDPVGKYYVDGAFQVDAP